MKFCLYERLQQNAFTKETLFENLIKQFYGNEEKMEGSLVGDMMELEQALKNKRLKKQNIIKTSK